MKSYYLKLDHNMLAYALLQRSALRRLDLTFCEIVEYDMALMRPWLPEDARRILDVGSGLAAIDARLNQVYPEADFYLLDKTAVVDVGYGMETEQEFYTSQITAQRLLAWGGIDLGRVHVMEATQNYTVDASEFDLVVSLFSWGWHYPIGAYAEAVGAATVPSAILIVDIRNWEGEETLLNYFEELARIELLDGHRCVYERIEK